MFSSGILHSFLPLRNPIGFGASDFVELAVAALLVCLILARAWIEPFARRLAARPGWCMALLAVLPVALRLALLPACPVPTPSGADDFSYLLLGDTLAHLRLANPPHPLPQFFEGIFTLQQPSYSSIFPIGQGLVLALGKILFGHPWAGVLLSVAALCSLCYWMLRAWTTPLWALAGGLLAVFEFGPLSQWTNCYWGGAVSAVAGCLVFGVLPRLRDGGRRRDAALLGLGIAVQLLARPFESILLALSAALFFLPASRGRKQWRGVVRAAAVAALAVLPAVALMLAQNKAVTGSWTTLPYMLSRYQYGVPATFTTQPSPTPHRELTAEQELDYRAQCAIHGNATDTLGRYFGRLGYRLRFFRFFLLPPLYLALLVFPVTIRHWRFAWVLLTLLIFSLGTNFYPYFYPHYIAAIACLMVLIGIRGLQRLSSLRFREAPVGREAAGLILLFCAAHFLLWYGLHGARNEELLAGLGQYETWDYINCGDPEGRIATNNRLAQAPGKQLVFVRYGPNHAFHSWIQNGADIDASRVVWALDLGAAENEKLLHYYSDHTAWLVEPDARPPRLTPYRPDTSEPGVLRLESVP